MPTGCSGQITTTIDQPWLDLTLNVKDGMHLNTLKAPVRSCYKRGRDHDGDLVSLALCLSVYMCRCVCVCVSCWSFFMSPSIEICGRATNKLISKLIISYTSFCFIKT